MKTRKLVLTIGLFLTAITFVFASEIKTEEFKVLGNCGMCESRIEKATSELEGVTKADWDKETKMLEVSFDESLHGKWVILLDENIIECGDNIKILIAQCDTDIINLIY